MRKTAVAVALMGLMALAPSANAATTRTQTVKLRVSDQTVRWESPRAFSAMLAITITVNGRDISYERIRNCSAYAGGRGASVEFNSCGPGQQKLRIRAISLRPVTLVVRYQYR